jgi:hypothetical protein
MIGAKGGRGHTATRKFGSRFPPCPVEMFIGDQDRRQHRDLMKYDVFMLAVGWVSKGVTT